MDLERFALVLEGGGMRGVFSAGVLDVFLEQGLLFRHVAGVSAGACHACSYLSGQHGRAFDISVDYLHDRHYMGAYSLLTSGDLFNVRFVYDRIPNELNLYDYDAYARLRPDFTAVVTNCRTGKAEYPVIEDMRRDLNWVRASASLPYVSRMVPIGGGQYLDGGLTDPIPLRHMQERGFRCVAVLTRPADYRKKEGGNLLAPLRYPTHPALARALRDRPELYNSQVEYVLSQERSGSAFVLRPQQAFGIERIEKDASKLRGVYELGRTEALRRLPELLEFLQ